MNQTLLCLFAFAVQGTSGDEPSKDWRDTLKWLLTRYDYPPSGPNYDWPDSGRPKVVDGKVYAIDGRAIPVPEGACELGMIDGYEGFDNASPYPTTGLSYRLKIAGAADGRRKFDRLKELMAKSFGIDVAGQEWKQYDAAFEIAGRTDKTRIKILVPGRFKDKDHIEFPDEEDYIAVDMGLNFTEHFYFSRWHLRVVKDRAALSDGTIVPIVPDRKVVKVDVGNVQGKNEASVSYSITAHTRDAIGGEFKNLYTFYAKQFDFPVSKYKVWDSDTQGFILAYEDAKIELRIAVMGAPADGGLSTDLSGRFADEKWSHLSVQLFYKGKKQIIPGTDEPLPKPPGDEKK